VTTNAFSPAPSGTSDRPWWRDAVFYQVYPRSFADGNGDGTGDLVGLREHLDYLVDLGVDALWLSPFFTSPMADGGYDVADPCDVDPIFGTLADFDDMLTAAHARGIRVTIDIVPNHFSDQHPWFQAALAAAPGSPERARFIFRDGRGAHGELPPNNWPSVFGGPAWHRVKDGARTDDPTAGEQTSEDQWYLHIFAPEQPDLNWNNPEVPAEFERIMRFWLDRGVDGFRVDVAHSMAKPDGLPDMDLTILPERSEGATLPSLLDPRWDQDGVHEYHRGFRRVLDSYPGDRMAVGEAWVADDERLAQYVRGDELNLTFNFKLVQARWGASSFRDAIDTSLSAMGEVGAAATWVLSNHDVVRHVTRYGDGAVGLARARAAALVQLSLPGAVYLYNGDELGLPNVDLPDWALQDPTWERSEHEDRGRDGERVPLPWSGDKPPFGFGTDSSWLPLPEEWASLTVEKQEADPTSTLTFYRHALATRRATAELHTESFAWLDAPPDCLAYRRDTLTVFLNAGDVPVALPAGELVASSEPITDATVPANTAVWLR
jgi:alpha-glucosidase